MPLCVLEDIDDLVQSLLRPDESVIWVRRPQQGIRLRDVDYDLLPLKLSWGVFPLLFEGMMLSSRAWLAAVFALASLVMAVLPDWQFVILGSVWGISQFAAGFLMDRARRRRLAILASPQARLV